MASGPHVRERGEGLMAPAARDSPESRRTWLRCTGKEGDNTAGILGLARITWRHRGFKGRLGSTSTTASWRLELRSPLSSKMQRARGSTEGLGRTVSSPGLREDARRGCRGLGAGELLVGDEGGRRCNLGAGVSSGAARAQLRRRLEVGVTGEDEGHGGACWIGQWPRVNGGVLRGFG